MQTLKDAASNGKFLYGHQDDLMYGHSWHLTPDETEYAQSDVFEVCGDYPAILGYDLGGIELGDSNNLDGNSFLQMKEAAVKNSERGGILTISWHPRNPLTGGDAWDVSSNKVVESILPGGEKHEFFMDWLKKAADYISTYDGMPIIFRPWHENSGSWFWWGAGLCTSEQFKQLWIMTYDYFVKERGLTNLVWAYSPNGVIPAEKYLVTYPGDEYVDIMGFDQYVGHAANFISGMQEMLSIVAPIAKEHNKILAVSETGYESIPDPKWWTEQLLPAVDGYPVAYALTWRNASDRPTHFYGPWKGTVCEDDFVAFYASEKTSFLGDLK